MLLNQAASTDILTVTLPHNRQEQNSFHSRIAVCYGVVVQCRLTPIKVATGWQVSALLALVISLYLLLL